MKELARNGQQKSSKRNRYTWMTKNDAKTNDLCECIKRFEDRWLYMMLLNEPSRVERGKLPTFVRVQKSPFASTAVAYFFPMHVFMIVSFCFRLPGSIRHPCNRPMVNISGLSVSLHSVSMWNYASDAIAE